MIFSSLSVPQESERQFREWELCSHCPSWIGANTTAGERPSEIQPGVGHTAAPLSAVPLFPSPVQNISLNQTSFLKCAFCICSLCLFTLSTTITFKSFLHHSLFDRFKIFFYFKMLIIQGISLQIIITDCVLSPAGVGCSMGDTLLTKVSTETQPLLLCLQEWKERLLRKSIRMQPMVPGCRYWHICGQSCHWRFCVLMHLFEPTILHV